MHWTTSKVCVLILALICDASGAALIFSPKGLVLYGITLVVFGSVAVAMLMLDRIE